jgi:hypothetical protein
MNLYDGGLLNVRSGDTSEQFKIEGYGVLMGKYVLMVRSVI